jgi:hypothetical protein
MIALFTDIVASPGLNVVMVEYVGKAVRGGTPPPTGWQQHSVRGLKTEVYRRRDVLKHEHLENLRNIFGGSEAEWAPAGNHANGFRRTWQC